MKVTWHHETEYECPECGADVESAAGPDYITNWRCRDCDWATSQDTYDPNVPEEVKP